MHKNVIFNRPKQKKMETKQLVDAILETVRAEMTTFIEEESDIKCPVEYETRVIEIARMMSRNLIAGSQGTLAKSRNGKKKS